MERFCNIKHYNVATILLECSMLKWMKTKKVKKINKKTNKTFIVLGQVL